MLQGAIKNIVNNIMNFEPVSDIVNGILLIAKGVAFFVFFPLKLMGIELIPIFTNFVYLLIIFYILYKLLDSVKWAGLFLFFMIMLGLAGF